VRVLLVSNPLTERCGVGQYGRHLWQALVRADVAVESWHSTPESPLPDPVPEVDLIHVNWHAATVGHLQPFHFLGGPPLSVFVHEPMSVCPLNPQAALMLATERTLHPETGVPHRFELFPNPCLDYVPRSDWDGLEITLGFSGIRHDGLDWIEGAIDRQRLELVERDGPPGPGEVNPHAWRLCPSSKDPDGWLSDEAELERMAQHAMNVYHYHSGNSGQSYAVMMAIAARRPLLLNHNRMLEHIWNEPEAEDEVYVVDDVAEGVHAVVKDLREGREKRPERLAKRRAWSQAAPKLVEWWGEVTG
jgi:hypothetical protein